MEYSISFILLSVLSLGCSLGLLLFVILNASDPEEHSGWPSVQPPDGRAARQPEFPALLDQRPLAETGTTAPRTVRERIVGVEPPDARVPEAPIRPGLRFPEPVDPAWVERLRGATHECP